MYQKIKLNNGARILLVPSESTKAVTVLALFKVGSRNERKQINGVSHFVEHLMFKGTKKRPTTLDISKDLDRVGAEYNAYTGKDHTGYYIKIDSAKINTAIEILHDILYHSRFNKKEIDRERNVIIEEINMYKDNPMLYVDDLFEELVYEGSSLAWQIAGPREVIKKISRQEILRYRDRFYLPRNMVIAIAGKIPDNIMGKAEGCFGSVPKNNVKIPSGKLMLFPQDVRQGAKFKLHYKKTEQVQLALGFPAYKKSDPRLYALNLLSVILGGNMSSRLFINIREKRGLAYFVNCHLDSHEDIGSLMIHSGLDKSRIKEALQAILRELRKIKKDGVSQEELRNAKDFLRGKITLKLEDSSSLAAWFGNQELFGLNILTPEEKFKKFNKVTAAEVKKVAKEIIEQKRLKAVLIGPFKNNQEFQKLLKI